MGIDANKDLEPDGTPVKKHIITSLKRECGLTDVFEFQHKEIGDTSIKKDTKSITLSLRRCSQRFNDLVSSPGEQ